jgi:RNA polymerase sigma factor (sigma-70 family)
VSAATATRGGEVAPEVLSRAKTGDQRAFTEVVRHYDPRLRALAYRLLGDRASMDDALQEAYVKAFRALPGFREDAGLGTWLYQITYRACVDLQRREGRHRAGTADRPAAEASGLSRLLPPPAASTSPGRWRPCRSTSAPPFCWSTARGSTTTPPPPSWTWPPERSPPACPGRAPRCGPPSVKERPDEPPTAAPRRA